MTKRDAPPGDEPRAEDEIIPMERDPLVSTFVEKALDLIRHRVSPEELEARRAMLHVLYETDPEAVEMIKRYRAMTQKPPVDEPPVVEESGERVRSDAATIEQKAARKRVGGEGQ
jgi:hypothetical protein